MARSNNVARSLIKPYNRPYEYKRIMLLFSTVIECF